MACSSCFPHTFLQQPRSLRKGSAAYSELGLPISTVSEENASIGCTGLLLIVLTVMNSYMQLPSCVWRPLFPCICSSAPSAPLIRARWKEDAA